MELKCCRFLVTITNQCFLFETAFTIIYIPIETIKVRFSNNWIRRILGRIFCKNPTQLLLKYTIIHEEAWLQADALPVRSL